MAILHNTIVWLQASVISLPVIAKQLYITSQELNKGLPRYIALIGQPTCVLTGTTFIFLRHSYNARIITLFIVTATRFSFKLRMICHIKVFNRFFSMLSYRITYVLHHLTYSLWYDFCCYERPGFFSIITFFFRRILHLLWAFYTVHRSRHNTWGESSHNLLYLPCYG